MNATEAVPTTPVFHIGMLIFDGMTNLDFAGPFEVFARLPATKVHVIAKTMAVKVSDSGMLLVPNMVLDNAPALDMLFIGGGAGVNQLMEDREVLDFVRRQGNSVSWITSVCTGALVLGAAGLLDGYRAATHWAAMEVLPLFGAIPVHERVVIDRNRITGGGVTAGIDFGLTIAAMLYGENVAMASQLAMEYDPKPPYDAGSPRSAPPAITERVRTAMSKTTEERFAIARRIMAKR